MLNEEYFTLEELAKLFKTSQDFWRKNIRLGNIRAKKLGRLIRITKSDVEEFIQEYSNEHTELKSKFKIEE